MELCKTKELTELKRFIKKHGVIDINNGNARGQVIIKGVRCYKNNYLVNVFTYQIDVVFKGELFLRYIGQKNPNWYNSSCNRRSNHKTNRLIRRGIFRDVKSYLKFFSIEIPNEENIKKLTWE